MRARPREHFRSDSITSSGTYRNPSVVNVGVPKHDAKYFGKIYDDYALKKRKYFLENESQRKVGKLEKVKSWINDFPEPIDSEGNLNYMSNSFGIMVLNPDAFLDAKPKQDEGFIKEGIKRNTKQGFISKVFDKKGKYIEA